MLINSFIFLILFKLSSISSTKDNSSIYDRFNSYKFINYNNNHEFITNHHIYKRQILDRFNKISKNLTNNQSLFGSILPPILTNAVSLVKKKFNGNGELNTTDQQQIKPRLRSLPKNDQNYLKPINRKRKFKIDINTLNVANQMRSLAPKNRKQSRSRVIRPIVKLDNLNGKDPFGIKKNSLSNENEDEYCYQQIELTTLPIRITSPNYHKGDYPPNSNCIYNLTSSEAPYDEQIKLNIINLELEDSKKCEHDYLSIQNTSIRFCGDLKNKVFYLNQSTAVLNFRSDIVTEFKGFEIEVSVENEYCKSLIKLKDYDDFYITSPNYPKNYPDSIDCWTLIDGENLQLEYSAKNPTYDDDLSISFTFLELEMEPDALCNIDYVELFEVNLNNLEPRTSLGKFCEYGKYVRMVGDKKNKKNQLVTNGNQVNTRNPYLYLHFKTDKLINSKGFKAKINVNEKSSINKLNHTCNWKADNENKKIISPLFPHPYSPNFDCSILIEAPQNDQLILLTFERFILEPDINCTFDRFLIYEPTLKEVIRKKRSPIGTQNANLNNLDLRRFLIGNQIIRASKDRNSTKINEKIIEKQKTSQLKPINLLNKTLENDKPIQIMCGKMEPNSKFISKSSKLVLRFITDDFGEYLGFVINYKFITKDEAKYLNNNNKLNNNKLELKEINEKDLIEYEFEPKDADVSIGSSYILKCKPKGFSKLNLIHNQFYDKDSEKNKSQNNLKWFKDDDEITTNLNEDKTVLLIREFHASSTGNYQCKFGKSYRQAWLKIKNETNCNLLFQRRPKDLVTTEGEYSSVILECNAVIVTNSKNSVNFNLNKERIRISWFHNDKPVKLDDRIKVLSDHRLIIGEIKKEDSGYYSCFIEDTENPNCHKISIASVQVKPKIDVSEFCGRSMLNTKNKKQTSFGKIVGGTEAIRGEFPWQTMLWDSKRNSFCGGVLLNQKWVATAAHCFKTSSGSPSPPLSQIIVRLGKHDQNLKEDGEFSTQINDIYFHPQYNSETFDNDLALIQVRDHIIFNEYIQPICLGTVELQRNFFKSDEVKGRSLDVSPRMAQVSGWGQVRENGPQPRFMQQLTVPLQSDEECRLSTTFKVTSNMFCAGYGQDTVGDSCKGDSGSPLTYKLDGSRAYLVGIVSWGEGCGKQGKYGFYTKVYNYLDWINALIQL